MIRYLFAVALLALPLGCGKAAPASDPAPAPSAAAPAPSEAAAKTEPAPAQAEPVAAKDEANAPSAIVVAGAPSGNHARVQGTWTLDFDRTIELDPKMKELVAGDPAAAAQFKAAAEKLVFTIGPSEITYTAAGEDTKIGYAVNEDAGDTLEVTMNEPGRPASEGVFTLIDDDHATMKQGSSPAVALERKTP